jgi:hypothetical protein
MANAATEEVIVRSTGMTYSPRKPGNGSVACSYQISSFYGLTENATQQ